MQAQSNEDRCLDCTPHSFCDKHFQGDKNLRSMVYEVLADECGRGQARVLADAVVRAFNDRGYLAVRREVWQRLTLVSGRATDG